MAKYTKVNPNTLKKVFGELKEFSYGWIDVYKLDLTKEELKDFITENHQINGSRDYLWEENKKRDQVLIYRKD